MNIREHVRRSINAGLPARRTVQGTAPGVQFLEDDAEFIEFDDLGYNAEFGYFRLSALHGVVSDCTNENPETIHLYDDGENGEAPLYVWMDGDGYPHMLGELHQLAELYAALGEALAGQIAPEPVSKFDPAWGQNYRIAQAVQEAVDFGYAADPGQIADSIRAAARRGAIRGAALVDGEWSLPKRTLRHWLVRSRDEKRGRPRKNPEDHNALG